VVLTGRAGIFPLKFLNGEHIEDVVTQHRRYMPKIRGRAIEIRSISQKKEEKRYKLKKRYKLYIQP
jgi:hypothetical protein